jgi:hypothetical protein
MVGDLLHSRNVEACHEERPHRYHWRMNKNSAAPEREGRPSGTDTNELLLEKQNLQNIQMTIRHFSLISSFVFIPGQSINTKIMELRL